jgi:TonB family protein
MKGALLALDKCMDNLMTTWGLDPTKQRQRRSAPEPANEPANWFQPGDYPTGLNRNGIGAVVILRLLVGSDGRVTNCAISKAGGDKSFEDLACRLATARARFKPAIGADGKPMDSVWINGVRWEPAPPFLNRAG